VLLQNEGVGESLMRGDPRDGAVQHPEPGLPEQIVGAAAPVVQEVEDCRFAHEFIFNYDALK
jgi:hypothetical protein